jgi:hypothetical protein
MVYELAFGFGRRRDLLRPSRHNAVPHERVAAKGEPVRLSERADAISFLKAKLVSLRMQIAEQDPPSATI